MAKAVPAYPGLVSRQQPDGTTISVRLHGDEYLNFITTADGYTIKRRADGFYCYACCNADGQLEPTDRVARNADQRSDADQQWLQGIGKYLSPAMRPVAAARQQRDDALQARARAAAQARTPLFDYGNFHGLIILVEYNDRKFSRDDYSEMIDKMVNQENYKGYGLVGNGVFTGSVRDYFYDNSNGVFSPQFDIVGPVTVNVSQYYAEQTKRAPQLTKKVVDAVDKDVDFSRYDLDKDGEVDMVYMIFAGYGAQHSGDDDSKLIWPHASEFFDVDTWGGSIYKDGVRLGRYACSTEMWGTEGYSFFDGIGTMCHEFSHVLGLPDLYDTDYEKSGGQSNDPGSWTIMAGGGYENNGRTPSGYSIYERYSLGFARPDVITEVGSYELDPVGDANFGYRLNTQVKNEFFLIENRQRSSKWDQYLPGHGMLVFRVDSTNASVWYNNTLNCNPKHNYFEVVRAGGARGVGAYASDPFPGTAQVTMLNNTSSPANLLTWSGQPSMLGFDNISEKRGRITFDIVDVNVLLSIALPETLTIGKGLSMALEPKRTPDYVSCSLEWSTDNPAVATIDVRGVLTAHQEGQAVITVVANGDENLSAQCVVTVEKLQTVPDIATYREQANDKEAALELKDALVVFATDEKAFVRDASGSICIDVPGLGLTTGDLLNGQLYGKKTVSNGAPMLQPAAFGTNAQDIVIKKGHEVKARRLSLSELTDADRCDLITITAATLQRNSDGVWITDGSHNIRVYNLFQVTGLKKIPPALDGKYYDVTGIYYSNKDGSATIDEIEITASIEEVEGPSDISTVSLGDLDGATPVTVYTTNGCLVARTTVGRLSSLPLRHGLYIIKTAVGILRLSR